MLLTRISQPPPSSPTPEDIFSSALTTIFTDDTVNSHGTPGSYVTYRSPRFGDLKLCIPAHPDEEDGRKLFAHYLWNAAVVTADATECASQELEDVRNNVEDEGRGTEVSWDRRFWDLRGKTVLELGAGTALPSLIAALCGAKSCTITDHPSSPALTTRAIQKNVEANFHWPDRTSPQSQAERDDEEVTQLRESLRMEGIVHVLGYTWGTSIFYLPDKYGKPASPSATPNSFERIIIADCLWMPSQHINLIKTILHFLPYEKSKPSALRPSPSPSHGSGNEHGEDPTESPNRKRDAGVDIPSNEQNDGVPCALVVAGFHTGRRIVSDFFSLATEPQPAPTIDNATTPSQSSSGAESLSTDPATANTISLDPASLTPSERQACGLLRLASAFEVDVDGKTRAWQKERLGEGKWEAKRWCVVGVLVRR